MEPNTLNALNWLLHPLSSETFLTQHWNNNPLYIAGTPEKIKPLQFTRSTFMELVNSISDTAEGPELQATTRDKQGHFIKLNPMPEEADTLYNSGHSLILRQLEEYSETLAQFRANLKLNMNAVGNVKCDAYMTPGEGGLGMHFDQHHVFIIQLEGSKRWQFSSQAAVDAPTTAVSGARDEFIKAYQADNPWAQVHSPENTDLQEATLTPGDVLFMPPGIWHNGIADDYSLSITFYVELRNPTQILLEQLEKKFSSQSIWRQHIPLPHPDEFNNLEVPTSIRDFFTTRLDEIRSEIETLSVDDLINLWLTDIYTCDMPMPLTTQTDDVQLNDNLIRTDVFPIRYAIANEGKDAAQIHLYLPDNQLTIPLKGKRFLDEIKQHKHFRASEAMHWIDNEIKFEWTEIAPLLNLLIDSGVLSVERKS